MQTAQQVKVSSTEITNQSTLILVQNFSPKYNNIVINV